MKVIVKKPGEQPYLRDILNNLKEYQEIVGGYIEVVYMGADILMICNEEGKLNRLEHNFYIPGDTVVGTVFFVGKDGEDFRSLTDTEVSRILNNWFKE